MSLVDMGLVLLILSLVLGLGVYSIRHMLKQGRESRTMASLVQVKDCLVKRAVFNNRYPTYAPGVIDCDDLTYDVNACFCVGHKPARDAWNTPLHYIEGLTIFNDGLQGGKIFGDHAALADAEGSLTIAQNGDKLPDMAFILVSHGQNAHPDDASYALKTPAPMIPGAPPDFSASGNDDIFLQVTTQELRRTVAQ